MQALRVILRTGAAVLLTLLLCVAALWSWSGSDSSLATTLKQITRWLPPGQTLEVKDVTGSLRQGGRIGWLRWQQGQLSIEASDLASDWVAARALEGELRLTRLAIGYLRIEDRSAAATPAAPTTLQLPLHIDAQVAIGTLEWNGSAALQSTRLAGHYIFDGQTHRLEAGTARMASGNYHFSGQLQAQAPLQLAAQLQGSVQTTLPGQRQPLRANARLELKGPLAGRDATLELQAQLVPEAGTASKAAMQASVVAQLQPWQTQSVISAKAQWQALNLAALWPQAPQTSLTGKSSVTPDGPGWRAVVETRNTQAGPWNQQRLPLDHLQSTLLFTQAQWAIDSLQASAGSGRIEAQGSFATGTPKSRSSISWQGKATVHQLNPALIDSRLTATRLDGRLTAQQTPAGLAFDTQLQSATAPGTAADTLAGLRLKTLQARGLWHAPSLQIDALLLQTDDAQVQGRLQFQTDSTALQGQLTLNLPGASASVDGQMASKLGQGAIDIQIRDATQATNWLARWSGPALTLGDASIQGDANLSGHWKGGWQNQGRSLQIDARLQSEQLTLRAAGPDAAPAWRLQALRTELSGTLGAWKITTQGQAEQAGRHLTLNAQAHGQLGADGAWQAELESARLVAPDRVLAGAWTLELARNLDLRWQTDSSASTLEVGAGSARLSGPLPGQTLLNWQPMRWAQHGARSDWQTQGSLQGLPLAWLDRIGQNTLAQMGIGGDLLLGGQWAASGGESLQLRATLERSSGDLLLQTDDARLGTLRAGIGDARLLLTADGTQVDASLRWASERAGQAQARFNTRLTHDAQGWRWPLDAPLRGTLNAQLPPLADWSRLAPPGWRLRGTLAAQAELSGTRAAPQWHGTLQAQDLALSSVVDGIDFSKGSLHAKLDGQRLEIVDFKLSGAATAGLLTATGSIDWLPERLPASPLRSRLRMALDIQAQALAVSALADRRLVLSGQLSARLESERLTLRGKLAADQALFVLPEDTAPQLGEDVVLRQNGARSVRAKPDITPRAAAPAGGVTPDILVSLDLGPRFRVRGHGLTTRLGGQLELRSGPASDATPRLNGELRALGGTYKAYGQQLSIEEGVLRFNGPYDNPALDILAIRPQLQQRVGVRISGSVLSPIVRLYADPDLPDAEKLSWLVLGRSPANGGSEAAMLQQAALSLLGGKDKSMTAGLANAFGLDQLSLGSSSSGATSGTTTGEATVTLGKNIARNFYVAYERGLTSALGSFYIFYELSRRFTLRAQTGEQSTLDLIFTLRYD